MHELAGVLTDDSAHAKPAHIIEHLSEELALCPVSGATHTIYQELWHLAFWQQMTLDWISDKETPYPASAEDPFPNAGQTAAEPWPSLCKRFLDGAQAAATVSKDTARLQIEVRCPSRPGLPVRMMTVEDQLISLAAHNAYHFGRIVVLRQILGAWPPPSGGFNW